MGKILDVELKQVGELAKLVAGKLKGGEIFALVGTLGSGKTTFVKAVGKALKIRDKITSPTFILLQGYETKIKGKKNLLFHLDLYRTKNYKEVKALGLNEFWGKPNTVTFIEWADKIKKHLPKKTTTIHFRH
jgi:tRNA threonylcarbamoyladenosine biosynthesis protein TsaE